MRVCRQGRAIHCPGNSVGTNHISQVILLGTSGDHAHILHVGEGDVAIGVLLQGGAVSITGRAILVIVITQLIIRAGAITDDTHIIGTDERLLTGDVTGTLTRL